MRSCRSPNIGEGGSEMIICGIILLLRHLRMTRQIIIVTFQVRLIAAHNITGINPLPGSSEATTSPNRRRSPSSR